MGRPIFCACFLGALVISAGAHADIIASDNAADPVYAIRPFQTAMQVGQTLTWDMDNGNIASGQVVGLRLLSNASDITSRVFEARFVGGDTNYTLIADPNATTSIGFSREGLHLEYTLTRATTFSLKIVRLQNMVR